MDKGKLIILLLNACETYSWDRTINHIFKEYQPYKGKLDTSRNGALISMAEGVTSGYAMAPLQARGIMFVKTNTKGLSLFCDTPLYRLLTTRAVYAGMVIGECPKPQDIYVNPCQKKQLTNIRAAGADEKIVVSPPKIMTMEDCIAYMSDDEMVEITPLSVRLRKVILDPGKRARSTATKKK